MSAETDALCADFLAVRKTPYLWSGVKDGVACAALLKAATLEEVRARWGAGLTAEGFNRINTVAQLRAKWNDLTPKAQRRDIGQQEAPEGACVACGEAGESITWGWPTCPVCADSWRRECVGPDVWAFDSTTLEAFCAAWKDATHKHLARLYRAARANVGPLKATPAVRPDSPATPPPVNSLPGSSGGGGFSEGRKR